MSDTREELASSKVIGNFLDFGLRETIVTFILKKIKKERKAYKIIIGRTLNKSTIGSWVKKQTKVQRLGGERKSVKGIQFAFLYFFWGGGKQKKDEIARK